MDAYRVCMFKPEGYSHSHGFVEIAALLKCSLDSLGVPCDLQVNQLASDRTNILLGANLVTFTPELSACRYIPYQLEQIDPDSTWFTENMFDILRHAHQVWDYSTHNIAILARNGIEARHVSVGYHPKLERIPQPAEKPIDVLFYGSINERRQGVLQRLADDPDIAAKILFGAYGQERDAYVAASKIVLNVHAFAAKVFETVRISYLLNNRCFVLAEDSPINPYPKVQLPTCTYDELVEKCRYYLSRPRECRRMAQQSYVQFRENYPMTSILSRVLS